MLRSFRDGETSWNAAEQLWDLHVPPDAWLGACLLVQERLLHPLATLFGEDAGGLEGEVRLHALFIGSEPAVGVHVWTHLPGPRPLVRSIFERIPWVVPFEREVGEMYGVEFQGSPDTRALLLHEAHPRPPMLGGLPSAPSGIRVDYPFRPVMGESIYEIPVGPVHAGVIEPGHFRFQALGEKILNLEVRLGYTHKGTERLFEGRPAVLATLLAESVSGDMSVAGAVAYCHAVERALDQRVPRSVESARGALLELERIAFLLGDVAGIALDTGYAAGAAQANVLREAGYQALAALTGSRLGRSAVSVGGIRRPLHRAAIPKIGKALPEWAEAVSELYDHLLDRATVEDRILGTGVIRRDVALALNLVGPVARASGLDRDLRRDRPYGAYAESPPHVIVDDGGDVRARLAVKVQEIVDACRLAGIFLGRGGEAVPAPSLDLPGTSEDVRNGLGWVESPRGELLVWVAVRGDGGLARVHFRDPSFLNWPAIEFAVVGNIVPDFPLCNKSLNLSYSGYDR